MPAEMQGDAEAEIAGPRRDYPRITILDGSSKLAAARTGLGLGVREIIISECAYEPVTTSPVSTETGTRELSVRIQAIDECICILDRIG